MPERNASTDSSSAMAETTSSASTSKGLSRIAPIKKLVHTLIDRSELEISSLHISSPDASGLSAKGKIRLSHIGTGPIPLVGLKVKFKDDDGVILMRSHTKGKKIPLARVKIEPLTLQPGMPGSVSSEVELKLMLSEEYRADFVKFIKDLIQADPKTGVVVELSAKGVQVKAFGLKFGDLKLQKEIMLGGLGCLGGALIFDDNLEKQQLQQQDSPYLDESRSYNTTTGGKDQKKKRWSLRKSSSFRRASLSSTSPPRGDSSSSAVQQQASRLPPTASQLVISNLEIIGGHATKGIQVKADVTLENPATSPSITLEPGELRFVLCVPDGSGSRAKASILSSQGYIPSGFVELGSLSLEAMVLKPGSNKVKAGGHILLPSPPPSLDDTSSRQYQAYKRGQETIAKILQNEVLEACAVASIYDADNSKSGASSVGWLAEAFEGTRIDARIPPLGDQARLLDGAELRVEGAGSNSFATSISDRASSNDFKSSVARATLRNGFAADIRIDELTVLACSSELYDDHGNVEVLELGKVNASSEGWDGITLKKGGEPTHVSLPMEINPDPKVLIEILFKSARSRHVALGDPLTALLEELRVSHWSEAGWSAPPKSRPSSSVGTSRRTSIERTSTEPDPSDDLASLLSRALANLQVTAHIGAVARIGDFAIPGKLQFVQKKLAIALSTATATALLPLVGQPFVKAMVDRADVEVTAIKIKGMNDQGIQAKVGIRLVNFGPLNANVRFVTGLQLRDTSEGNEEKTMAILECNEDIPILAGVEKPVEVDARIVMPSGVQGRELFSAFVTRLLQSDSAHFNVFTERLFATSGGVQFDTSLNKPLVLYGLGGFQNLVLDQFEVVGEARAPIDGISIGVAAPDSPDRLSAIQFRGKTTLKNRGDLSLSMHKLEVGLYLDDAMIGQASLDQVELQARGACTVEVSGVIYAPSKEGQERVGALRSLSCLIEGLIAGSDVNIQIKGQRGWVMDAEDHPVSLAWLDDALKSFQTDASLQWKGGVPVVEAVNVGCIEAVFPARGSMQIIVEEVTADYSLPFPINVGIESVQADLEIMFQDRVMGTCSAVQDQLEQVSQSSSSLSARTSPNNSNIAKRKESNTPSTSGKIRISLQAFELKTDVEGGMGEMISHAMQAGPDGTSQISLRGTAKVVIKTVLGLLDIRVQLGKDHLVKVAGLDGLRTSPFQYTSLEVVSANPKYILARLDLFLNNPSESIRVRIPDSSLTMSAYFKDAFLGDVILGGDGKGIVLNSGPIKLPDVEFRYRPTSSSEPRIRPMLTQFLSGNISTLSIRGHSKSSINSDLAQALAGLSMDVEVRPIDKDILNRISVQLGMNVVTSNSIDAKYKMRNPIKLDIDILHLEVLATYRSRPFGTASKSYDKNNPKNRLLLPAGQDQISNDLIIKLSTPLDKLVWAFLDERGSIVLDVEIKAVMDIKGFIIPNFEYTQRVPLDVTGLQGVAKLLKLV
ncbi:hypothetical protein CBS101457_004190 [Exobasidium rhododendri]|nr:hypothetical protein CBS101457_004190 [Exobasidium rhododendri]